MNTSLRRKIRKLDLDKALGDRLAEMRSNAGVRQIDVAKALHVGRPLVSKIENGHRALAATEIVDYAHAIGVEPAELFEQIADIVVEYDGKLSAERERR